MEQSELNKRTKEFSGYVGICLGDPVACVDGNYTADQLRQIADLLDRSNGIEPPGIYNY